VTLNDGNSARLPSLSSSSWIPRITLVPEPSALALSACWDQVIVTPACATAGTASIVAVAIVVTSILPNTSSSNVAPARATARNP
jgi:hypothetical protein